MFTGEITAGGQRGHPNGSIHRKRFAIAPGAEERTYGSLTLLKVEESRLAPRVYPREQRGRRIGRKKPEDLLIRYNLEDQKREQQRMAPRFRGNGVMGEVW